MRTVAVAAVSLACVLGLAPVAAGTGGLHAASAATYFESHAKSIPSANGVQERLWSWPTRTPVAVNRPFDPPYLPWLPGHRGVDLAAPLGSVIHAPADGSVVFAGQLVDRGVVSVLHSGGLRSTYEPVDALAAVGDHVRRGQPIGTVQAGHNPGPLHWGARFGKNEYVNPLKMLVGPTVLKPWVD